MTPAARRRAALTALLVGLLVGASGTSASAGWSTSGTLVSSAPAATTSVTLSEVSALSISPVYSEINVATLNLTNTGTAPLTSYAITASNSNSALAGATRLWFWTGTCATPVPGTATIGTLSSPPALPTGVSSGAPAGTARTVCAATQVFFMPSMTTPANTSTLTLTGRVGTFWTTTTTQALTQTAALAVPTNVRCTASGSTAVTIAWNTVTNASSYEVMRGSTIITNTAATSTLLTSASVPLGTTAITVVARNADATVRSAVSASVNVTRTSATVVCS